MAEGNWGQFDGFTSAEGGASRYIDWCSDIGHSKQYDGATDGDSWWNVDVQMQFGGYGYLRLAYTDMSDD